MDTVFPNACQHDPLTQPDGGSYDYCKDVASTCSAITEVDCNKMLNPFTTTKVEAVLTCYDAATGTDCQADFETCIGLP
jgi:hypothetical protein